VFPFGGVVNLRVRWTCHQVSRFLSCGSSELRRRLDAVGPYGLGPSSSPLARIFVNALDLEVFRHLAWSSLDASIRIDRPPVFFDATAEYTPQRRVIGFRCRSRESSGVCAGQNTERQLSGGCASGYRSDHPRGWGFRISGVGCEQAHAVRRRGPDHSTHLTRTRHRPRPGAVVFPPYGGGRSSDQRRAASTHRQAGVGTRALEAGHRLHGGMGPEPSGAFCYGSLSGFPTASGGRRDRNRSQRWPEGCLARGVSPR